MMPDTRYVTILFMLESEACWFGNTFLFHFLNLLIMKFQEVRKRPITGIQIWMLKGIIGIADQERGVQVTLYLMTVNGFGSFTKMRFYVFTCVMMKTGRSERSYVDFVIWDVILY